MINVLCLVGLKKILRLIIPKRAWLNLVFVLNALLYDNAIYLKSQAKYTNSRANLIA